jgi:hypothetical protein
MREPEGCQRLGKRGDNQAAAFAVVDNRLQSEGPSTTKVFQPLFPRFVRLLANANASILTCPARPFHIDRRLPLQRWPTPVQQSVV